MSLVWWNAPRAQLLGECNNFSISLRQRQYRPARARAEAALFLYRGSRRIRLTGYESSFFHRDFEETPPHNNIIRSAVDWFTSIMVRNVVRPYFMTIKGNADAREKADARQRVVDGTMGMLGLYGELGALRARDGHLFRGGGIKYAADVRNSRVIASRVRPWEVFTPEREARLGFPRQITHSQLIPREALLGMFDPDSEEYRIIEQAEPESIDEKEQSYDDYSEMLLVNDLWHLPSVRPDFKNPANFGLDDNGDFAPEAKPDHDGRHVLHLRNGVLIAKPRPFNYFPISMYRPFREPVGFWSQGIPEIIGGAHVALLEIGDSKLRYLRRHAVPHLVVWDKAKPNFLALSNDDAKIWTTKVPPGQAMQYLHTDAVPAELLQYEQQILSDAKEVLGVSNMNLFGEKPKGVDHQPGMEYLSEMTEIRQTASYQAWERAHIDDAGIISDCYFELAQENADLEVTFGDAKELATVTRKQMEIEREAFQITCQPTSAFATTPQAKFRQVKEWLQAGLFNGTPASQTALRLLSGPPDTDAATGDLVAADENIERCLDAAAKGLPDEQWIPQPYMGLGACKTAASDRINRMEADGEDPEAIDRVVHFYELAAQLEGAQGPLAGPTTQVAPQQLGAPAAPPPAAPPGAAA